MDLAKKENSMFRQAVSGALPEKNKIISINDFTGCDSANSGSWVGIYIDPSVQEGDIRKGFIDAGWSPSVDSLKKCGETCDADLAKKIGNRVIGVTWLMSGRPDRSSGKSSWEVVVDSLDNCWNDNGYNCV